jgi:transcriptional regulator with PAS, ATPase and Fis domain
MFDVKIPCILKDEVEKFEAIMILKALNVFPNNKAWVAKHALGMKRTNLIYKIKKYKLKKVYIGAETAWVKGDDSDT